MSRNNENELITVDIEPQQIRPLANELNRAHIPFQFYQDPRTQQYSVETHQAAAPILQHVLNMTEQWDVFDRKPEHRNTGSDAMFAFVTFAALGTIIMQSSMVADWANGVGLNGNFARGVAIIAVGWTLTLVCSELFLHHDKRRGMFRGPLLTLFACAGIWFILTGCGMDLAGEAGRWLP